MRTSRDQRVVPRALRPVREPGGSGARGAVDFLRGYYALVAAAVREAGGTIVKTMGDGVLFTFPRNRARDAVDALRESSAETRDVCRDFDANCSLHVRLGVGTLLRG